MSVKRFSHWSPADLETLAREYPLVGPAGLVEKLQRSRSAIQAAASRLGVKTSVHHGEGNIWFSGFKDVPGVYMGSVRLRAQRKGLAFEITAQQIYVLWRDQGGRCFYSGRSVAFADGTASLDRIDSQQGYTMNNITIVHKDVNSLKMRRTHDEFLRLVHLIDRFQS